MYTYTTGIAFPHLAVTDLDVAARLPASALTLNASARAELLSVISRSQWSEEELEDGAAVDEIFCGHWTKR